MSEENVSPRQPLDMVVPEITQLFEDILNEVKKPHTDKQLSFSPSEHFVVYKHNNPENNNHD